MATDIIARAMASSGGSGGGVTEERVNEIVDEKIAVIDKDLVKSITLSGEIDGYPNYMATGDVQTFLKFYLEESLEYHSPTGARPPQTIVDVVAWIGKADEQEPTKNSFILPNKPIVHFYKGFPVLPIGEGDGYYLIDVYVQGRFEALSGFEWYPAKTWLYPPETDLRSETIKVGGVDIVIDIWDSESALGNTYLTGLHMPKDTLHVKVTYLATEEW